MARQFVCTVGHYSSSVYEEKFHQSPHWICVVDGETREYRVKKDEALHGVKNWYERGTVEIQYHARNTSRTGLVLWSKMPKNEPKMKKSTKEAIKRMEKLL